jgi:PadR family transcriptional regulator
MGKDQLQGALDLLILKTLERHPMHGYGIAQRIQQISADALRVEEGSLYPALHRLEQQASIAAEWRASEAGRRAKFYRLTPAGRKQLARETANWGRVSSAVEKVLRYA